MKWLINGKNAFWRKQWDFVLRQNNNIIVNYNCQLPDLSRYDVDTVMFFEENEYLLKQAKDKNLFTVLLTDKEDVKFKYKAVFRIQLLKEIIDNMFSNKTIPEQFNYTMETEAWNYMMECIKNRKEGIYNIVSEDVLKGQDIIDFYGLEGVTFTSPALLKGVIKNWHTTPYFMQKIERRKVNIYIPTYYRWEKSQRALSTIYECSTKSMHDIEIYVGDNNTKDEAMRTGLEQMPFKVYFSDKNIGKANMVNHLHRNARDCDYIFSIDGDMTVISQNYNPFDRMIEYLEKCHDVGLVSSQQEECCHHWFNRGVDIKQERGFTFGYAPDFVGVAGGCVAMRKCDWEAVGMYKENHDIYTGDDSILTYNIGRKLNKMAIIAMDAIMLHPNPSEDEKGYTEWKSASWKRDNTNFIKDHYTGSNTKGYYDE